MRPMKAPLPEPAPAAERPRRERRGSNVTHVKGSAPADALPYPCYVCAMITLLDEAIARLKALPEDRREAAAAATLDVIEAWESNQDAPLTAEEEAAVRALMAKPRRIATPEAAAAAFAPRAE